MKAKRGPARAGVQRSIEISNRQKCSYLFFQLWYPAVFTSTFFQRQFKTKQRAVQFEKAFLRDSNHLSPAR